MLVRTGIARSSVIRVDEPKDNDVTTPKSRRTGRVFAAIASFLQRPCYTLRSSRDLRGG